MKQPKTLWGLAVVLVDFRQAVVEVVFLVIDGVAEGQFHKIQFGKYLFHSRPYEWIEAKIII